MNLKEIIKEIVSDEFDLITKSDINIYFDMDGVLAAFEEAVHKNPKVQEVEESLLQLLRLKPELADMHHDELRNVLRGAQEDSDMKKIKKAFNQYRALVYKAASEPGYFVGLDILPGAVQMMKTAANLTGKLPHILTAPMENNERCEKEKREWVEAHLSGLFGDFSCTQNKHNFAKSKYDILIDDRPKYVNKFREAGGTAILHTSPGKTIQELQELVSRLKTQ